MSYIGILITYIFVNNFILVKFMGICPFIGVSKNSSSAIGMGVAVTFVTSVTSVVCWMVYYGLLAPFGLEYLRTISFILVIAAMVQLVEMVIRKFSPSLYKALGIYLPLITTNCAVLSPSSTSTPDITFSSPSSQVWLQESALRWQLCSCPISVRSWSLLLYVRASREFQSLS